MKRYVVEAPSLSEALRTLRKRFGDEVLVLETLPSKSGGYRVVFTTPPDPNILTPSTPVDPRSPTRRQLSRRSSTAAAGAEILDRADSVGLSESVRHAIKAALANADIDSQAADQPSLKSLAGRALKALIKTRTLADETFGITAVVGATGVGKTTTLAKLASRAVQRFDRERVVLVTTDTFRVAATDQIRAYARLLGVRCEVAETGVELAEVVNRHRAKTDRIFIDTTGSCPLDVAALDELAAGLDTSPTPTSVLLCVPANARRAEIETQLRTFAQSERKIALAITKWDESRAPGEALSVAIEWQLPLSHVAIGQRVPEDLLVADSGILAASLLDLDPSARTVLSSS